MVLWIMHEMSFWDAAVGPSYLNTHELLVILENPLGFVPLKKINNVPLQATLILKALLLTNALENKLC